MTGKNRQKHTGSLRRGLAMAMAVCAVLAAIGLSGCGNEAVVIQPAPVNTVMETYTEGLQFELHNADDPEGYVVTGFDGDSRDVVIPAVYKDMPVLGIGMLAFHGSNIVSVKIPDSVVYIGSAAFEECARLEEIVIPDSVYTLDPGAFSDCTGLKKVTVGRNAEGFYGGLVGTFTGCTALEEVNVSPENEECTSVDGVVFTKDGSELQLFPAGRKGSYSIPEGVASVHMNAFDKCEGLLSLSVPRSMTGLEGEHFTDCTGLTAITVAEGSESLSSVDGVLYSADGSKLICVPAGRRGGVDLPDGVTEIGSYAASNCENLTEISLPDGVDEIGVCAFSGCKNLTEISLPDGVDEIGVCAFSGCENLTEISLPDSVRRIGKEAFAGSGIESLTLPAGLAEEGAGDIFGEYNLSIYSVGFGMFAGVREIIIPKDFDFVDARMFTDCWELTDIHVEEGSRYYKSVDGVLYSKDGKTLVCYPCGREESSVTVPDGVEVIGDNAFDSSCLELQEIILPDSLTRIGRCAFFACRELESVTIPEGVTYLGDYSFACCDLLRSVTIPASVTRLNGSVFAGLGAVYVERGKESIEVAEGSRSYKTVDGILYTMDGKTLVKAPECYEGSVVVPDGVTAIDDYAFSDCKYITSVTLPEGLVSIGVEAFNGCGIKELVIPDSVASIDRDALCSVNRIIAPHEPSYYNYTQIYDTNEWTERIEAE